MNRLKKDKRDDLILIKGQRYKEFHYTDHQKVLVDNKSDGEFYLFFLDKINLEIIYVDLLYVNGERVTCLDQIDEKDDIYCPMDVNYDSNAKVGKFGKEIFAFYFQAEKELKKLKREKIDEIDSGKKWEYLRGK